jgi:hypothetical protein
MLFSSTPGSHFSIANCCADFVNMDGIYCARVVLLFGIVFAKCTVFSGVQGTTLCPRNSSVLSTVCYTKVRFIYENLFGRS